MCSGPYLPLVAAVGCARSAASEQLLCCLTPLAGFTATTAVAGAFLEGMVVAQLPKLSSSLEVR